MTQGRKAKLVGTTFQRRQRILELLREERGARVTELARLLSVSEGTIRNDHTALEKNGQLTRVRGGAVLNKNYSTRSPAFEARARVREAAKQRIACWAADMVEDGDSILLDSSTTVFYMAPYLENHRKVTIITNGIEVALTLARNPSHTVVLIGGVLRPDGASIIGHLGEKILDGLHIKTAFVSCSGLSVEAGLTEADIQYASLKSRMIRSAGRVVALGPDEPGAADRPAFPQLENALYFGGLAQTLRPVTRAVLDPAQSPQDWNTLFLSSPDFMR